jgi:ribonuclease HI
MTIKIWTDGACIPNPGVGGWGFRIEYPNGTVFEKYGGQPQTTNNRMELTAILEALRVVPSESNVVVSSDSTYAINRLKLMARHPKQRFTTNQIPNMDLWLLLNEELKRLYCTFNWVRGHSGDLGNERADFLADRGRLSVGNSRFDSPPVIKNPQQIRIDESPTATKQEINLEIDLPRLLRLTHNVKRPRSGSFINDDPELRQNRRWLNQTNKGWAEWIHSQADWRFMLTLTLTRHNRYGFAFPKQMFITTIGHFIRWINCAIFGKRLANKGCTIGSAVVLDYGFSGEHPHAHILIAAPSAIDDLLLSKVIHLALSKTKLINFERWLSRYMNIGGSDYLAKHDSDHMVESLLRRAKYSV